MHKLIFGTLPLIFVFLYYQTLGYLLANLFGIFTSNTYYNFMGIHSIIISIQLIIISIMIAKKDLDLETINN